MLPEREVSSKPSQPRGDHTSGEPKVREARRRQGEAQAAKDLTPVGLCDFELSAYGVTPRRTRTTIATTCKNRLSQRELMGGEQ